MIQTTIKNNSTDLTKLFIFDNYDGVEVDAYADEIGTLIFQSALMHYMAVHSTDEVEGFEDFVNKNIESESFLEILFTKYPLFEKFLTAEMKSFQSEIFSH